MDEGYQCMDISGYPVSWYMHTDTLEIDIQRVLLDKQGQHCLVIITYKKQAKDRCCLTLCLFFTLQKEGKERTEERWRCDTE